MNVLLLFLIGSFLAGGIRSARPVRQRPWYVLGACFVVAASFYSLRVIS